MVIILIYNRISKGPSLLDQFIMQTIVATLDTPKNVQDICLDLSIVMRPITKKSRYCIYHALMDIISLLRLNSIINIAKNIYAFFSRITGSDIQLTSIPTFMIKNLILTNNSLDWIVNMANISLIIIFISIVFSRSMIRIYYYLPFKLLRI